MIVLYILLGIAALVLLILLIGSAIGNHNLKKFTNEDSCIIFGKKGKGKTLLFSKIALNSKTGYASNTDFKHKKGVIINPVDIGCGNSWLNFLTNNVTIVEKNPLLEKKPVLLDDAGVYLPNFMDYQLQKQFTSMPVSFAIWRHLYDAPIHINCQACDRVWKLLREQATYFINCRGVNKFLGFGLIKFTIYDRHESAERELQPLKGLLFNKYSKADIQNFKANNGMVKNYFVIVKFSHHKYDSRYFHKVVFGEEAPKKANKRKKKTITQSCAVALDTRQDSVFNVTEPLGLAPTKQSDCTSTN